MYVAAGRVAVRQGRYREAVRHYGTCLALFDDQKTDGVAVQHHATKTTAVAAPVRAGGITLTSTAALSAISFSPGQGSDATQRAKDKGLVRAATVEKVRAGLLFIDCDVFSRHGANRLFGLFRSICCLSSPPPFFLTLLFEQH
jgi:hypothetical protein